MSEIAPETAAPPVEAPTDAGARCLDCGAEVRGPFCQQCGQRHDGGALPLRTFIAEAAADIFSFDSRAARTLRPLVTRPGFLTTEYLAGKRARYLPPFRLYLGISLIYFVVIALSGASKFFFLYVRGADPQFAEFVRLLPRLMFLLLPAFALLLAALYRGRLYAAHLVFALHFHAFAFLVLPVDALLDARLKSVQPGGDLGWRVILAMIVTGVIQLWVILYLGVALRRVYGGSRLVAWAKTVVLFFGYVTILVAVGVLSIPWLREMVLTRLRAA